MKMPEAAMHEDHFTPARENQVWLSGQVGAVKAVAVAYGVNKPTYCHFGRGMFRPDRSHHLASVHSERRALPKFLFKPIECCVVLGFHFTPPTPPTPPSCTVRHSR
jgi:hypothetical protein